MLVDPYRDVCIYPGTNQVYPCAPVPVHHNTEKAAVRDEPNGGILYEL